MAIAVQKNCLLSLGSNVPCRGMEPSDIIEAAIIAIRTSGVDEIEVSKFYETEPVPKSEQPNFINCVVAGVTEKDAQDLLAICQTIELSFDRERSTRWGPRTLDIDIIDYDSQVYPNDRTWRSVAGEANPHADIPELILPHPRLHQRAFVLKPLCDLAASWMHPVYAKSCRDLLMALPDLSRAGVVPVDVK